MRSSQAHSFTRMETLIFLGLAGISVFWSWSWECYDMRRPMLRVAITLATMAASFGLMAAGLAIAKISGPNQRMAAFLAVLPWNSLLL